jgi:hypothetical protein
VSPLGLYSAPIAPSAFPTSQTPVVHVVDDADAGEVLDPVVDGVDDVVPVPEEPEPEPSPVVVVVPVVVEVLEEVDVDAGLFVVADVVALGELELAGAGTFDVTQIDVPGSQYVLEPSGFVVSEAGAAVAGGPVEALRLPSSLKLPLSAPPS